LLYFLSAMMWAALLYHAFPAMMGWTLWKHEINKIFLFLSGLCQAFLHSNELTHADYSRITGFLVSQVQVCFLDLQGLHSHQENWGGLRLLGPTSSFRFNSSGVKLRICMHF
jgi:hypothetical protein